MLDLEQPASEFIAFLVDLIPAAIVGVVAGVAIMIARRLLESGESGGFEFRRQTVLLSMTLLAFVALVIAMPISDKTQEELLRLIGLLLSAAIALASTTFLSNALGGLMLRAVRSFKIGDFIKVDDHFGRVTERGLFHTEIQTEDRDLITLPNLMLVNSAVRHLRRSGTIVSTTVSLGYDVRRDRIEACLTEAAAKTGLEEPFVQVRELGDFSVTYRVAGLLTDVKRVLSVRSELVKQVMDSLHAADIEIVSPTVMTTRAIGGTETIVPSGRVRTAPTVSGPEAVVFDKADEAERLESRRGRRAQLEEQLTDLRKERDTAKPDSPEFKRLSEKLSRLEEISKTLDNEVQAREDLLKRLDED